MNVSDAAAELHERTKHTWQRILSESHGLDWANHPLPFKVYPDLEPLPLPRELPESSVPATQVLSGQVPAPSRALDLAGLARMLFFSAGVTRILRGVAFRAAPSAGALYPTELYAVCGPFADLPAGVYHFEAAEFVLRRLRDGDCRAHLAAAAAAPAVASLPVCFVLTGIPWRTTWKYGQRGYRHLFWDAGAIVANLLAVTAAAGWGARVLLGFVDEEVSRLVGIGEPAEPEEYPLALVTVEAPPVSQAADGRPLGPISPRTWPLSPSPRRYPMVTAAQRAGDLPGAEAVTDWRGQAARVQAEPATRSGPVRKPGQGRAATDATDAADGTDGTDGAQTTDTIDTVEALLLRRGSTRSFVRDPLPRGALRWAMASATRPVPGDFVRPGGTLLEHFLAMHAVEGRQPGAYRWRQGDFELLRAGAERRRTRALCLGQDLGGDSAVTVFHCAELAPILEALGSRGYRAAQLEAGVAAERVQLAAFALGFGATGLTFLDDDVSRFFGTDAAPMLSVAVGVPAYRARPGMRPAQLPRIDLAER
jgi:SagB-type dehydrogenase family enzyme